MKSTAAPERYHFTAEMDLTLDAETLRRVRI
jgi:hypothetical protein